MVGVGLAIAVVAHTALAGIRPHVRVLSLGSSAPTRRILAARRLHSITALSDTAMLDVLRELATELR